VNLEPELPLTLDGRFQLWVYSVSMSRLILRSFGSPSSQEQLSVEVLFQGVDAMLVRHAYEPLTVREATPAEIEEMLDHLETAPPTPRRFLVLGEHLRHGWVVCGAVATATNALDYTNLPELLVHTGGLGAAGGTQT
jgi:hypothetical protein